MWPKRRIWLLGDSNAGLSGMQVLLEAFGWDVGWGEQRERLPADAPLTDVVFWPEVNPQHPMFQEARRLGIRCGSGADFLHKLWSGDVVLPIAKPEVVFGERPLLWSLLETAGFEPSLIWPSGDGNYGVQRGRGGYWVVPASWLDEIAPGLKAGRSPALTAQHSVWKVREQRVDFYGQDEERTRHFVGTLPRWADESEEVRAMETIAWGMELGITWRDVCAALGAPQKPAVVEVESA